ncbi:hypothetical protein J6TS7_66540 [Paenibacillus dendritiformis]|nr:hypothetical protein J6TS7_66540 [Paenibacillus dendritiformis]
MAKKKKTDSATATATTAKRRPSQGSRMGPASHGSGPTRDRRHFPYPLGWEATRPYGGG